MSSSLAMLHCLVVFEGGKNWFMNFETRSSHVRIERGGGIGDQGHMGCVSKVRECFCTVGCRIIAGTMEE
nr:hypothetical protein [Tanacetum cinerariifolium]